jgi:uncharacterized delta-60 repeat protein
VSVLRFLPSGQPDPTFGVAGRVTTDLGLSSPTSESHPPFKYQTPAVAVTGLTVDAEDRPVLTGNSVSSIVRCYPFVSTSEFHEAYVARLTAVGTLDPSFAGTGVRSEPGIEYISSPTIINQRDLLVKAYSTIQCLRGGSTKPSLISLEEDGQPNSSFGSAGFEKIDYYEGAQVAVDPFGRILLLGFVGPQDLGSEGEEQEVLTRLSPNGAVEAGFGRIDINGMGYTDLGVDRRGRPLLARSVAPSGGDFEFELKRLTGKGKVDRSFGNKGVVRTRFRGASAFAQQVLVDSRGRILVGGVASNLSSATGDSFVLARYLSGTN